MIRNSFQNSDRELPPGDQGGQGAIHRHSGLSPHVGPHHPARAYSSELNIGAFLKFPACIAPLHIEGRRTTIEGVRHHFTDETGQDRAELFRLWVAVRDRKGVQLGRYELSPSISPQLGAELGRYLCPSTTISGGKTDPADKKTENVEVDKLLAGLVRIVANFEGFKWVGIPEPDTGSRSRAGHYQSGGSSTPFDPDLPLEQQLERLKEEIGNNENDSLPPLRRTIYMKPKLPGNFQDVAERPDSALDRQWISAIETDGRYTTVEATIVTGRPSRVTFNVNVQDENDQTVVEESFSVAIPHRPGNEASTHLALEHLIAEAMYDFLQRGLNAMRDKLSEEYFNREPAPQIDDLTDIEPENSESYLSDTDDRLLQGDLLAGEPIFEETLPSGAQVRICTGSTAALVTISANESLNSSSRSWAVSDEKLSEPSSSVLRELLQHARMLCAGDIHQRRAALEALNALALKSNERSLFGKCGSLDETIGQSLEFDLVSLRNISFDSIAAATQDQVLELLNGVQLIQVSLSHRPSSSRGLTRFNRIIFGMYPDGSLSVRATNQVGGQIRAKLSAATCDESATESEPKGFCEIIRLLSKTLNAHDPFGTSDNQEDRRPGDRQALLAVLESLVHQHPDTNTIVSPFDDMGRRIPPLGRTLANQVYDRAGKYARIWAAASGGSVSEVLVEWIEHSNSCLVTIPKVGANNDSLSLTLSHRGVHKVVGQFHWSEVEQKNKHMVLDLQAPGQPLEESPRLSLLQVRQIFERAIRLSDSRPQSWKDVRDSSLARFFDFLRTKKGLGNGDQE